MKDFKPKSRQSRPARWARVRMFALGCLFLGLLLGGLLRAADLQIRERGWLRELAQNQYLRQMEIPARRGEIFDRRGVSLAQTVDVDSIWVDPSMLSDLRRANGELAKRLSLDPEELYQRLSQSRRFAYVKRWAKPEEVAKVRALDMPGLFFSKVPRRFYPHRELAANVLGLTGADGSGLEGLELAFNEELAGRAALLPTFRDAKGRKLLVQAPGEPSQQRGASIHLTLDSHIQHISESVLAKAVQDSKAVAGMAVVLDPQSGELLALANYPSFNPNALRDTEKKGLRNRAALDTFEPGSTFKAFVVAAAREEKAIQADDLFYCENGAWDVGRNTIHDTHPHGYLTAAQTLQVSSNICAAKIAQSLGRDRMVSYFHRFSFGEPTALGLPGETFGVVPYPKSDISFATMAFGQGLTSTAVQLASGFAAIANGGSLMRPFLVAKVVDSDGLVLLESRPTLVRRVISERTARQVISMLEGVVEKEGTAPKAKMAEFRVAGKTGTAQKADPVVRGYSDKRIASFVGLVPAESPRCVILIIIDEPKTDIYGGQVAAPAFREIATQVMPYLGVPAMPKPFAPQRPALATLVTALQPSAPGTVRIPDLVGAPGKRAVDMLRSAALEPQVFGAGKVAALVPPAGSVVPVGARVRLELRMRP